MGLTGTHGVSVGSTGRALLGINPGSTAVGSTPFAAGLRRMAYEGPAAEAIADDVVRWLRNAYERPQEGDCAHNIEGGEAGQMFRHRLYWASSRRSSTVRLNTNESGD